MLRVGGDQVVGRLRAPGTGRVADRRLVSFKGGGDDASGFLHPVGPGEDSLVTVERAVEQPSVRPVASTVTTLVVVVGQGDRAAVQLLAGLLDLQKAETETRSLGSSRNSRWLGWGSSVALGTTTKVETVNRALAEVAALAARRRDLKRLIGGDLLALGDDEPYDAAWR